jgi:hypothetical protein
MRQQKAGRIVNISSVLGLIPAPFSALYSSTKHALEGYSESLDHEVRTFGIRICLLEPAYTGSSFEQNMLLPDRSLDAYVSARIRSSAVMHAVMKTADSPEIVAEGVVEAATTTSPRRRYTCGKVARQASATSFRPRTDVRQEPPQADGIAGLTGLAKPISTGRPRLRPFAARWSGQAIVTLRRPLRHPLLFGATLRPSRTTRCS